MSIVYEDVSTKGFKQASYLKIYKLKIYNYTSDGRCKASN